MTHGTDTHDEGFFGSDLTLEACEALMIQRWPTKERFKEPELMTQKWWDYRMMHPVHATYLFSHLLDVETRKIIRAYLDDRGPSVNADGSVRDWHVIKSGDVFEPPVRPRQQLYWERKIGGLIRARQAADTYGIPYPFFIARGLRFFYLGAGSYVLGRTERKIVEPNLLYGEACLADIQAGWLEQITSKMQVSEHPRYRLENDDGHPDHLQHRHWLVQQLGLRQVKEHAAARLVKLGVMRLEDLIGKVERPAALRQLLGVPIVPCVTAQR